LERAELWKSCLAFADAVQPMFYNPHVFAKLTQEKIDAALLAVVKDMEISDCGAVLKRGCVGLELLK
jgi:hypothetical protein